MSDNEQILNSMFSASNPKTVKPKDEIICIVDRSGSMAAILNDAEGGLNSFIDEQKKIAGGANLTLVEFDNEAVKLTDRSDINSFTGYKLKPRGGTALLDAIGMTVNGFDYSGDGKVIVVIVTDGEENTSCEYTQKMVFDLITDRKEKGWEFIFLAANQDAISTGTSLGISAGASINFSYDSIGAQNAYRATSVYTSNLRSASREDAIVELEKFKKNNEGIS